MKIVDRLRDRASSQLGKELASEMVPLTDIVRIEEAQKETTDAVTCILRKGSHPGGFMTSDHMSGVPKQEGC